MDFVVRYGLLDILTIFVDILNSSKNINFCENRSVLVTILYFASKQQNELLQMPHTNFVTPYSVKGLKMIVIK